jgi:hypothetical protein
MEEGGMLLEEDGVEEGCVGEGVDCRGIIKVKCI